MAASGTEAFETRGGARRRVLAIAVPTLFVVVVVLALLAIAWQADRANRAGALAVTEDLLGAIERAAAIEVRAFLMPAEAQARRMAAVFDANQGAERDLALFRRLARLALADSPQISLIGGGDPQGSYTFVRRLPDGATQEKLIQNTPGARRVWLEVYDAEGRIIENREDPEDSFDPRTRPWWTAAVAARGVAWTELYVFFTAREPGLTVSVPLFGPEGTLRAVIGIDISLAELSRFLASLQIGRSGIAAITDAAGRIVAYPDASLAVREAEGGLVPRELGELGHPALSRARDLLRVEGPLRRVVEIGGARWLVSGTPLRATGRDAWYLVMVAPEDDFTGFVSENNRTTLTLAGFVAALAALLALLFIRQSWRAEGVAAALAERAQAMTRQSDAFTEIAAAADLFDPYSDAPPTLLTERLAEATGARRASLWRIARDGRALICLDAFDRENGGHSAGTELERDEAPRFFAALSAGSPIRAADAATRRETAELHRLLLNPLGIRGLIAVPVRRDGRTLGFVAADDPPPGDDGAERFLLALANMLAARLSRSPAPATAPPAAPVAAAAAREPIAHAALGPLPSEELEAEVHPGVAVLVLRLGDPLALARRAKGNAPVPLIERLACALQAAAREHAVDYLKLMGESAVAAAGLRPEERGEPALARLARLAISLRVACLAEFEAADQVVDFRLGMHCGVAIGNAVGEGPRIFNLWGDAVRTAEQMAATAPPGAIQTTDPVQQMLRADFLFRPRGAFWLPRLGEMPTHLLVRAR